MWHPFDLIPEKLALAAGLRTAQPPVNRSVSFEERALTYFRDKTSKTDQWPILMDELPGIKITSRGSLESDLEISHRWKLDYLRTLTGTMKCSGAWHSPRRWSFVRTFKPTFDGAAPFAPVMVQGSWQRGTLIHTHSGRAHKQVQSEPAGSLLSTYALMSGFPRQAEFIEGPLTLLGEDLIVNNSARVLRCPAVLQNHPLAEALTGYLVDAQGDFPTEFWVNEYGLVVYVFNGVSKVFILTRVEEAA